MAWQLKGSYTETCSCELMCPWKLSLDHGAQRSRIDAFGVSYEAETGLSTSELSWAA